MYLEQLVKVLICASQECLHDGILNGLPLLRRHSHNRRAACTHQASSTHLPLTLEWKALFRRDKCLNGQLSSSHSPMSESDMEDKPPAC